MKNLVFTILCVICLFTTVSGQMGFRLGANYSTVSLIGEDQKFDLGVHFGLVNEWHVGNNIVLKPGILYSTKGGYGYSGLNDETKEVFKFKTLEIPFSVAYKEHKDKGYFIEAGPYLGILLDATRNDKNFKQNINLFDLGANFGAGYDFGSFIIGGQFGLSIINMGAPIDIYFGPTPTEIRPEIKNKVLAVYAIMKFPTVE